MFKYIDYSKPPIIDISLPPAITIHAIPLTILYVLTLGVDLYILNNEQHFRKYITSKQLRLGMAIVHITIPMLFITGYPPFDLLFAAVPWFLASYTTYIASDQLNVFQWTEAILQVIIIDNDEISKDKKKVRYKGLSKLSMGIFKIAVMHIIVNPLLPRRPEYALDCPWFSVESLIYTALFGIKAYLLLGVLQVYMSLCQIILGKRVVDLFDSPIIASSPRDFWSRRWNRVVRNLLHAQVFTRRKPKDDNDKNALDSSVIPEKTITSAVLDLKKPSIKKKSTKKTVTTTTTTTTTVTKRITRSSAKASADLSVNDVVDTPAIIDQNDERGFNDVMEEVGKDKSESIQSFWSTVQGRGLLSFIGLAVGLEVQLRQGHLKQEPQGATRILCIAIQFLFMSVTGRLFTGPFLRYDFFRTD